MRILRSIFLFLVLAVVPVSTALAQQGPGPDLRFVETMMEDWNITEKLSGLVSITADSKGTHIGMLFRSGDKFRVYKNGKLIQTQKVVHADDVFFFKMTDDGHLLYVLDPYDLYLDGKLISGKSNDYAYSVGLSLKNLYRRGKVIFIDGNMIREHVVATGRSNILYEHSGDIAYLRMVGTDIYYTVQENLPEPGYYIYRNGKKLTYIATSDPVNFEVTARKKVYYFAQGGENVVLYENEEPYHSTVGRGGFIYVDTGGNVLHAVVAPDTKNKAGYVVQLFRNGKQVNKKAIFNIEGSMAFRGTQYAARVQAYANDTSSFRLLKNGTLTGDPFSFSGMSRDFNGVQFGPDGKTYMRNVNAGKWRLFEDGKPIMTKTFDHVMFFSADTKKLMVFGTRPTK